MLNAVNETRMKLIDYKSIALPAELQGRKSFLILFIELSSNFFRVNVVKGYCCTIRDIQTLNFFININFN